MSVRVKFTPDADGVGFVGTITIACPDSGGVGDTYGDSVIGVYAVGETKADALHKAAVLAERIVTDPVMAAILPPQAQAAITATKQLASAAKRGRRALRSLWRRIRGPAKKRVAKALAIEQAQEQAVSEVGILPFAALAVKYGPGIAKKAYGAYKKRKARKAAAKKAAKKARAFAPSRRPPPRRPEPEEPYDDEPEPMEPEPMEPEPMEPEPMTEDDHDEGDNDDAA